MRTGLSHKQTHSAKATADDTSQETTVGAIKIQTKQRAEVDITRVGMDNVNGECVQRAVTTRCGYGGMSCLSIKTFQTRRLRGREAYRMRSHEMERTEMSQTDMGKVRQWHPHVQDFFDLF